MVAGAQTQDTEVIARAAMIDGRVVTVNRVGYSRAINGIGDTGFSVDISALPGGVPTVYGFASYEDALAFIKSPDDEEYTVFDSNGDESKQVRTGLGIPDGMVREFKSAGQYRVTNNPQEGQFYKETDRPNTPTFESVVPPTELDVPPTPAISTAVPNDPQTDGSTIEFGR